MPLATAIKGRDDSIVLVPVEPVALLPLGPM